MDHIHLHLHVDGLAEVSDSITKGLHRLGVIITTQGQHMSQELDDLTAEVTTTRGVMESALVLIQGFGERLVAAGTDPAKLEALRMDLNQGEQALANAVAANQPPMP